MRRCRWLGRAAVLMGVLGGVAGCASPGRTVCVSDGAAFNSRAEEMDVLLLDAFTVERDYGKAIQLARGLSGPAFAGWRYQERAKEMLGQLERRGEDFTTLTLPTREEWVVLRRGMRRAEQAEYLARRLRLVSAYEMYTVNFDDAQFRKLPGGVWGVAATPVPVVNPFSELKEMRLEPRELGPVVAHLDDQDFCLAYDGRKSSGTFRRVFRVSWLAGEVVNDAVCCELVDGSKLERATAVGQAAMKEQVVEWLRVNEGTARVDLLLRQLREGEETMWVEKAGMALVGEKEMRALPVLLGRLGAETAHRAFFVECCYRLAPERCVAAARAWVKEEGDVRFWAALILFTHGDAGTNEGFDVLKGVLAEGREPFRHYLSAFEPLLASRRPGARELAEGVLGKMVDVQSIVQGERFVRRLMQAGDAAVEPFLVRMLNDETPVVGFWEAGRRPLAVADVYVALVMMLGEVPELRRLRELPGSEAEMRREAGRWVGEQMSLVRQGRPSALGEVDVFSSERAWGEMRDGM